MDVYEFEASPDAQAVIDLSSDMLDTYLLLETPTGEILQNDDTDSVNHSVIEAELMQFGTYRVSASSFDAEEIGSYRLRISENSVAADGNSGNRDTQNIALGNSVTGLLQTADTADSDGRFQDFYAFPGAAGQNVRVEMQSNNFDTYLAVVAP